MRSPAKSIAKRVIKDAESELNLPPGFRFHPTDEELIVHYLFQKSQSTAEIVRSPLSIIADVDLYKHDPWELPELALFGTKEWYFFTPRDRKYPNSSRPNRVTPSGYWKATGADKPVKSKTDPIVTVGIKKALVFYAGQGVNGIKTNWIMHEYRHALPNHQPTKLSNGMTSKLNDWVLCRLYNKKNNPKEMVILKDNNIHCTRDINPASPLDGLKRENSYSDNSGSLDSFEHSDCEFGGSFEGDLSHEMLTKVNSTSEQCNMGLMENLMKQEAHDDGDEWFEGLNMEDLFNCLKPESLTKVKGTSEQCNMVVMESVLQQEDNDDGNDWLDSLSLEELHNCLETMPPSDDIMYEMPMFF